jgi:hypothetical protein
MKFLEKEWRDRVAKYIKTWRKTRNVRLACVELGINRIKFFRTTRRSRLFQDRLKYRKMSVCDTSDYLYVLRFAKKVRAVQLLGGKCAKCSTTNVLQLDFHHSDSNKESNVANVRFKNWETFWAEASKCELLCRNCHALTTTDEERFERLRDIIYHKARNLKDYAHKVVVED